MFSLGVSVFLVNRNNHDVRSRAVFEIESKTKSLKNTLNPPYIRLVPRRVVVEKETVVPIDIMLHSNGLLISEVALGLELDPSLLLIEKDGVQGSDIMPVVNMVSENPGRVYFSVFRSHATLVDSDSSSKEVIVATVYGRVIGESGVVVVRPVSSGDEKTVLYGERNNTTGDFPEYTPSLGEAEMIISSQ